MSLNLMKQQMFLKLNEPPKGYNMRKRTPVDAGSLATRRRKCQGRKCVLQKRNSIKRAIWEVFFIANCFLSSHVTTKEFLEQPEGRWLSDWVRKHYSYKETKPSEFINK